MSERIEVIEQGMEGLTQLAYVLVQMGFYIVLFITLVITLPVWIVPYLVYRRGRV